MYPELAVKPVKPRAESPAKLKRAASQFPTIPDVTDLQPDEILKCDRDLRINRPISPFPQEKLDNPELLAINMNKKIYENTEDIEKKFESLCKITDTKSIKEQSKHMEFNNFNTVPCPFSSLCLKFGGTKPSNITKVLPISVDEQLNKEVASNVLENNPTFDSFTNMNSIDNFKSSIEMNSSSTAEIKQTERVKSMKFPSRPVSPYPVYIPISRTATPIPSRQEVLDPPAIKPIDQEQTAVKNNAIEIKEKESSVSSQHINQTENIRSVCQEIQVADSSEITCSKPPEAVIGTRPIFGQLNINNELRKAFGLVKQTPVKESQKRQTDQQAENKSLSERRDSPPINQTVSEQVTEVKFDKRETQETVQSFECEVDDEIKQEQVSSEQMMIDASFDALVQDNSFENNVNGTDGSDYQPQPIKSLIKTFEESTMPVMKYKQIREPSSDIVMSLSLQSNGTKTHNSVEINKSDIEETKESSNTMSNFQQMSYSDVTAQESIDTNTEPVSNGADNTMFYVASARVQTRTYLPTAAVESVSSQQSSESFVEQKSEMFKKSTEFQSSEQIIQSSSSSSFQATSSSQNSSFIQVHQSGGQQLEGKMVVFSFVFWFLCVFAYIFVGENSNLTICNDVHFLLNVIDCPGMKYSFMYFQNYYYKNY